MPDTDSFWSRCTEELDAAGPSLEEETEASMCLWGWGGNSITFIEDKRREGLTLLDRVGEDTPGNYSKETQMEQRG